MRETAALIVSNACGGHVIASCGFLPEFAPVKLNGRVLGDSGLSLNAPFDAVLASDVEGDLLLYVVDLYARDGDLPDSLEAASEKKSDLLFGNQTFIRLKYCTELRKLRRKLNGGQSGVGTQKVVLPSYRPGKQEAGPKKSFDFSAGSIAQRWRAGLLDMKYSEREQFDCDFAAVRRG